MFNGPIAMVGVNDIPLLALLRRDDARVSVKSSGDNCDSRSSHLLRGCQLNDESN